MSGKTYNVVCPRKYKTRDGAEKTHFWTVGTAFPLRERDGFSVKLWTRILPTDELILFVRDAKPGAPATEGGSDEPPPEVDDIPF